MRRAVGAGGRLWLVEVLGGYDGVPLVGRHRVGAEGAGRDARATWSR